MDTDRLIIDARLLKRTLAFDACFEGDYFSCCPLEDIGDYGSKELKAIRLYHCVSFEDMGKEVMDRLKIAVQEVIENDRQSEKSTKPISKTLFSWELGR